MLEQPLSKKPQGPRVLIVEGQDDKHVVRHLCSRQNYEPNFDIWDTNGYEGIKEDTYGYVQSSRCHILGIVADANDNPADRWRSISDVLEGVGITAPPIIESHGVIIEGKTRVGIWLMPDNHAQGELEDFVIEMIPEGDPVWPLAQKYVESIDECDRKFADNKISTAYLYAWLATREEPPRMGAAIGIGDLRADGPLATSFVNWLRELFA